MSFAFAGVQFDSGSVYRVVDASGGMFSILAPQGLVDI